MPGCHPCLLQLHFRHACVHQLWPVNPACYGYALHIHISTKLYSQLCQLLCFANSSSLLHLGMLPCFKPCPSNRQGLALQILVTLYWLAGNNHPMFPAMYQPLDIATCLLSLQALVPLHWLVGNNHLMSRPCWRLPTAELQLAEALWELLHDCLMRFLPDQSLDVQQMLTQTLMVATPSLQQPALQNCQPLTDVVAAVLKRIA